MTIQNGIPIANYFDQKIYEYEKSTLFKNQISYIGSTGMVNEEGDYRAIERLSESKILTFKNNKYSLIDNICAHRQAKMKSGFGNSPVITCPYHRWSFEHDTGRCVSSPMCKENREEMRLNRTKLQNWKNLLFIGDRNFDDIIKKFYLLDEMQIENMVYQKTVSEKLPYNWKHYIDIYGENYHIPFIHPGFNFFLDLNSMSWVEENDFHAQIVKPKSVEFLKKQKTTPIYKHWINLLLDFYKDQLPEYAGLLLMFYPNIMIECYPLYMTISTIHPTGPESSIMYCDYFHHKDVILSRPDIVAAAEAASAETMLEDSDICDRTAEGRKFLYEQGRDVNCVYQNPLEDGLAMFHRYYQRNMRLTNIESSDFSKLSLNMQCISI